MTRSPSTPVDSTASCAALAVPAGSAHAARFFERGWDRAWDRHPEKRERIAARWADCTLRRVITRADEIFWLLQPNDKGSQ